MEFMSISAVTEDAAGSSAICSAPLNVRNVPRTLLTMRCRTVKDTSEWLGSMVQVPVCSPLMGAMVVMDPPVS